MKKIVVILLSILCLIMIIYYFRSDYIIGYKIDKFKIKEQYNDNKYYFEIMNNKLYNFDYIVSRKLNKKQIENVVYIKDGVYECIIPKSKKLDTYPLCYRGNNLVSYTLVSSDKIKEFFIKNGYSNKNVYEKSDKDFQFYNNLDKKEYIAVWKYNGFYIMNENNIKTINLFNKDRYSNDLCYLNNQYLLLPNYDQEHEFNTFYIVNIKNGEKEKIDTDYNISYESYIVGVNEDSVYLFDKKYKNEYEINVKKGKVKLIGNEDKGYVKYKDGKRVSETLKYFNQSRTFNLGSTSSYIYNEGASLTKTYKENKKYSTIIFDKKVNLVNTHNDKVYFILKDVLYEYIPYSGEKTIVKNFEWNFNLKDTIFIYNE